MAVAAREAVRDPELGAHPDGAAFIDGELVPIAEAQDPDPRLGLPALRLHL